MLGARLDLPIERLIALELSLFILVYFAWHDHAKTTYQFSGSKPGKAGEDQFAAPAGSIFGNMPPKYFTPHGDHTMSRVAFIGIILLIYCSMLFLFPKLSEIFGENASVLLTTYNEIFAAAIIVGLIPNVPFVKEIVPKAREMTHKWAHIPRRGDSFYSAVKDARSEFDSDVLVDLKPEVDNRLFASSPKASSEELFRNCEKIEYLLHCLDTVKPRGSNLDDAASDRALKFDDIRRGRIELRKIIEKIKVDGTDLAAKNAALDYSRRLLLATTQAITMAFNRAGRSSRAVLALMREFGIHRAYQRTHSLNWVMMLIIFLSLLLAPLVAQIITAAAYTPPHFATKDFWDWNRANVTLHMTIILIIFYLKYRLAQRDRWAYRKAKDDREFGFYAGAATVGLLVAAGLIVVMDKVGWFSLHLIPGPHPWAQKVLPFIFLGGVTSLVTAVAVDTAKQDQVIKIRELFRDGLVAGGLMATAASIAFIFAFGINFNPLAWAELRAGQIDRAIVLLFELTTPSPAISDQISAEAANKEKVEWAEQLVYRIKSMFVMVATFNFTTGAAIGASARYVARQHAIRRIDPADAAELAVPNVLAEFDALEDSNSDGIKQIIKKGIEKGHGLSRISNDLRKMGPTLSGEEAAQLGLSSNRIYGRTWVEAIQDNRRSEAGSLAFAVVGRVFEKARL